MIYVPTHLKDVVFNKVEDLLDLLIAAEADFTAQQLINIVYVILNHTDKYQQYIQDWLNLPKQKNLDEL